jgi:methylated-DNA-[protein]-cysteine S-methyltransferase
MGSWRRGWVGRGRRGRWGAANARNPVCLLVPCHRVIAADGGLHGYAFGAATKRWLLELEGVPAGPR